MKTTFIYSLKDPITLEIKYIGKADNLIHRLNGHLGKAKLLIGKKSNKNLSWIKSLLSKGLEPIIEELDVVPYNEWEYWETYWIWQFRSWDFLLKNGNFGGNGSELTEVTRKRLSEINTGIKNPMYGKTHTKEARIKISIGNTGKKYSNETKAKISKAKIGHTFTDEVKNKIADSMKGNKNSFGHTVSAEGRIKISEANKGRTKPKIALKLKGNKNASGKHIISEDSRRKMSAATKGKLQAPELVLKRKESLKRYWREVKAGLRDR